MDLPGSDDGGPEGVRWPCSWPVLPPGGGDIFSPRKEAQPHPVGRDWGGHCCSEATLPNPIPPSQQVRNSVDSGKEKWNLFLGAWLCGMRAGRRQPVASSGSAGCASGGLG